MIGKERERGREAYNLQAWVDLEKVATALRLIEESEGITPRSMSEVMRFMLDDLVRQAHDRGISFASLEEAKSWLERRNYSIKQIRGSARRKYSVALTLEAREKEMEEVRDLLQAQELSEEEQTLFFKKAFDEVAASLKNSTKGNDAP